MQRITPLDEFERQTQEEALAWVDSQAQLCRVAKPATPNKHLVSYFALIDGEHLLLVDHINAQLWLPTGGHVEPEEHPRDAVRREAKEELAIEAEFLVDSPVMITSTLTVGKTSGHTDVSLWYALKGNRFVDITFDTREFRSVHWFHKDDVPLGRTDPEMHRFLEKMFPANL